MRKGEPFIPSAGGKEVQMRCDGCGRVLTMSREAMRAWLDGPEVELVVPKESGQCAAED